MVLRFRNIDLSKDLRLENSLKAFLKTCPLAYTVSFYLWTKLTFQN